MDLSGQLSNPQPALEALADLDLRTPKDWSPEEAHSSDRIPRTIPRVSRPLKPRQVDALVAGYEGGKAVKELAGEFGIDRRTVSRHLRRANVSIRRVGLNSEQAAEAAEMYEAGWSSGRLAKRFDVSADTVHRALLQWGVSGKGWHALAGRVTRTPRRPVSASPRRLPPDR